MQQSKAKMIVKTLRIQKELLESFRGTWKKHTDTRIRFLIRKDLESKA